MTSTNASISKANRFDCPTNQIMGAAILLGASFTLHAQADLLPECTINFDGPSCPNVSPECGAFFDGGMGCVFANLLNCYSSGLQAYRVTPATPLTITFDGDVISLDLFFAHVTGASGTMRFFNADDEEVGEPLMTNGNCLQFMPDHQEVIFSEVIETVEVTAEGGDVWIDTMTINPVIPEIPGDLNGDGVVDVFDLLILISEWGLCEDPDDCPADLTGPDDEPDGVVDVFDLLFLISNWG